MQQSMPQVGSNPLATEKIGKLLARFSIPCIISMMVNSLYNIVDQIFIGQGVGFLGNSATNVAFPMVTISMAFALLIGDGGAAYLSLNLGAGEKQKAEKGVANAILLSLVFGVLFLVGGLVFMDPLLHLFGATDKVMPYAQDYTAVIIIGLPFVIFSTAMNSMIRADGSPKFAMVSMLSGAILNIILDPIFIFVLGTGVKGAAIATIIGQVVSACISASYLGRFKNFRLKRELFRPNFKIAKTVSSYGVSSFITQTAITLVVIVMNNSLVIYGGASKYGAEIPLAALGIVMKVNQILMSILIGVAVGSQPIVGFNYGAENYGRVKHTYRLSVMVATCCAAVGFIFFMFFPQMIVNIFGQEEDLYNEFAVKCFRVFLMCCVLNAFQISSSIFFQSIGKPLKSSLLSLSRQILYFIPLVLILPNFFGLDGVLYAGPSADFLAFLTALVFIFFEMRHLNRMQAQEPSILTNQEQV